MCCTIPRSYFFSDARVGSFVTLLATVVQQATEGSPAVAVVPNPNPGTASAEACCGLCNVTEGCHSWSYAVADATAGTTGQGLAATAGDCFRWSSPPGRIDNVDRFADASFTSGWCNPDPTRPPFPRPFAALP